MQSPPLTWVSVPLRTHFHCVLFPKHSEVIASESPMSMSAPDAPGASSGEFVVSCTEGTAFLIFFH